MKYLIFVLSLLTTLLVQGQDKDHFQLLHNEQQWAQNKVDFRGETEARGFDVVFAVIDIEVDPAVRYIQGNVNLKFKVTKENVVQLDLDLDNQLNVDSIKYQGAIVDFTHENNKILIPFSTAFVKGTIADVQIFYQGEPPSGSGFGSFIQSVHGDDDVPVLWTLSEPYSAREWWPCKQDLTDKIDSIDLVVTVPVGNKVAGNGLLQEVSTQAGKSTYHWKHRYPIPAYLVAFATTNYVEYSDTIPTAEGDIPQQNYVYPESLEAAKAGTQNLIEVMHLFNDLFGMYPFNNEKYGHAQFGWGGGMEHTTMTFTVHFGHGLLSHELAHQWFGNTVTCGSWEDIWLNEGFATYLEGLTYEHGLGMNTFDNWLINKANTVKEQPGGSVKVDDTTSVGRIFSLRLSYSKGAMVLHMLRWKIGDVAFFQGVKNYIADPTLRYGFSRTENLKAHLETTSGKDLTEFFDSWYAGEGYPLYYIDWAQDADNVLHLKIKQAQSILTADYFKMPVPLQAVGVGIEEMLVFENEFDGQNFQFQLSGPITELNFDPKHWLVAESTVTKVDVVGLRDDLVSASLRLAPNPVSDVLNLEVDQLKVNKFEIFDRSGKLILFSNTNFEHQQKIDVTSLKSGSYVLLVQTANGVGSIPFVKQ